jgi:hypothetical protein
MLVDNDTFIYKISKKRDYRSDRPDSHDEQGDNDEQGDADDS